MRPFCKVTVQHWYWFKYICFGNNKKIKLLWCWCLPSTLVDTVNSLTERGSTALGPGLTLCAGLVSSIPCSEIVLCTDGEPNKALGALNKFSSDYDPGFYTKVVPSFIHK